jgi:hypothetical protein
VVEANWEAMQLQAVVFLKRAVEAPNIFSDIVGETPDTQEERLREALKTQSGPFRTGILQVTLTPIRLDIILAPVIGTDALVGAPPTLGAFEPELNEFAALVTRWLPQCALPAIRLALVARALAPAESPVGAYEILKRNLSSVNVEPGIMRDLLFRVNWRVNSPQVVEGYFNRLTTWSALAVRLRTGLPGGPERAVEGHYAHREIDVNTPAEHSDELPPDQYASIFKEIQQVVVSTGQAGERP